MMTSQGSSPSFATPKKENKEMTTSQGGSMSFVLCPFTNCIKWISNTHKKLQPTSLVWFLLARSLSKCCIAHCPFLPYLCICQGVLTSPCTRSYNNEASSGDAASERSQKPKRCIKWWCNKWNHKNLGDASGGETVSEITKTQEMHQVVM
jgi:hypothetical protein